MTYLHLRHLLRHYIIFRHCTLTPWLEPALTSTTYTSIICLVHFPWRQERLFPSVSLLLTEYCMRKPERKLSGGDGVYLCSHTQWNAVTRVRITGLAHHPPRRGREAEGGGGGIQGVTNDTTTLRQGLHRRSQLQFRELQPAAGFRLLGIAKCCSSA